MVPLRADTTRAPNRGDTYFINLAAATERRKALEEAEHSLIVEDDALFGPSTFELVPRLNELQDDKTDLVFLSAMLGP